MKKNVKLFLNASYLIAMLAIILFIFSKIFPTLIYKKTPNFKIDFDGIYLEIFMVLKKDSFSSRKSHKNSLKPPKNRFHMKFVFSVRNHLLKNHKIKFIFEKIIALVLAPSDFCFAKSKNIKLPTITICCSTFLQSYLSFHLEYCNNSGRTDFGAKIKWEYPHSFEAMETIFSALNLELNWIIRLGNRFLKSIERKKLIWDWNFLQFFD